jgi:hypothetical protein
MVTENDEIRGAREVTEGPLTKYGEPYEENAVRYGGRVQFEGVKLQPVPMRNAKGNRVSFNVLRRGDLPISVSCFGDLADQCGALLMNNMRVTVDGRIRITETNSNNRITRYTNIPVHEVGIWDSADKVHWLQYEPAKFQESFVEPLPGAQGSVVTSADLKKTEELPF